MFAVLILQAHRQSVQTDHQDQQLVDLVHQSLDRFELVVLLAQIVIELVLDVLVFVIQMLVELVVVLDQTQRFLYQQLPLQHLYLFVLLILLEICGHEIHQKHLEILLCP